MALNVIVKNTFLDVDEPPAVGETRRCSSLPRTWKPGVFCDQGHYGGAISSDASVTSTSAPSSREAVSDTNSETGLDGFSPIGVSSMATTADSTANGGLDPEKRQDSPSVALRRSQTNSKQEVANDCLPNFQQSLQQAVPQFAFMAPVARQAHSGTPLNPEAVLFQMPPYAGPHMQAQMQVPHRHTPLKSASLCSGYGTATRLNPEARAFQPVTAPLPEEVSAVVGAVKAAMGSSAGIAGVKVVSPTQGQPLTIVAEMASIASKTQASYAAQEALSTAKAALLGAAAHSQSAYILGYTEQPFKEILDTGFRTTIGLVPEAHQDSACWDTYQKGYCPRRSTCRWSHPQDCDLTPIRVILKKPEAESAGN